MTRLPETVVVRDTGAACGQAQPRRILSAHREPVTRPNAAEDVRMTDATKDRLNAALVGGLGS